MMRPWIAVAYSAPVAAATAVFIIYPIGQGSFSDGMPLGKCFALSFYFIFGNNLIVTRLKGKTPPWFCLAYKTVFLCENSSSQILNQEVNSLSNQILRPSKKPGVYMIHCLQNDKRYYGETSNISQRLASHKSCLRRNIHANRKLQHDWNVYGENEFHFVPLFLGPKWTDRTVRLEKELFLILQNTELCYNHIDWHDRSGDKNPFANRKHSEQTKKLIAEANRKPNDTLGKGIVLNNIPYPSLAEASRQTGMARKTIRKRLNDENDLSCVFIDLKKFGETI
jgi:hypothetical protein